MTGVMEPVLDQYLENNRNTIYQVKWDGVRMLCFVEKGEVILQNRRAGLRLQHFPELNSLGKLTSNLVLDKEIVVLKMGGRILPRSSGEIFRPPGLGRRQFPT